MKESIFYYMDYLALQELSQTGSLIPVSEIALVYGMSYRGFRNMHLPLEARIGRRICYESDVTSMKWAGVWEALAYEEIESMQHVTGEACSLSEINVFAMRSPAPEKYAYYENYYRNTGKLAHPVFVDEQKNIVSGYIAYLLAKQYNLDIEVFRVSTDLPVQKIICGHMVVPDGNGYTLSGEERERQIYGLDESVSAGEVLWVRTERDEWFMRIEHIQYVTGKALLCDTKE